MRRIGAWFGVCLSGFWVGFVGSGFWVGFVGVVVCRCLAGFWVLQSVPQGSPDVSWAILARNGAAPAGLVPPLWLGETVLRRKAAWFAFVVLYASVWGNRGLSAD